MKNTRYYDVEIYPDGTWRVDHVASYNHTPVGRGREASTEAAEEAARSRIEKHKEARRIAAERAADVLRFQVDDD